MANRFRNERIEIKLTKEEKEVFEKKMKLANCKTMSHFLRKCVLEKEIYVVDIGSSSISSTRSINFSPQDGHFNKT